MYIGRPSFWGNKYRDKPKSLAEIKVSSREEAVEKHKQDVLNDPDLILKIKKELKGKILGCWCKFNDNPLS